MMKIKLTAQIEEDFEFASSCVDVPDDIRKRAFRPLKTVDDPLFSAFEHGAVMASSDQAEMVMEYRKDAADFLAKQLAKLIVEQMKRNDTLNGYKIEEDKDGCG